VFHVDQKIVCFFVTRHFVPCLLQATGILLLSASLSLRTVPYRSVSSSCNACLYQLRCHVSTHFFLRAFHGKGEGGRNSSSAQTARAGVLIVPWFFLGTDAELFFKRKSKQKKIVNRDHDVVSVPERSPWRGGAPGAGHAIPHGIPCMQIPQLSLDRVRRAGRCRSFRHVGRRALQLGSAGGGGADPPHPGHHRPAVPGEECTPVASLACHTNYALARAFGIGILRRRPTSATC